MPEMRRRWGHAKALILDSTLCCGAPSKLWMLKRDGSEDKSSASVCWRKGEDTKSRRNRSILTNSLQNASVLVYMLEMRRKWGHAKVLVLDSPWGSKDPMYKTSLENEREKYMLEQRKRKLIVGRCTGIDSES